MPGHLPWESSTGLAPWQVSKYFTDGAGNTYQVFADPGSPSGYRLKKIDKDGNVSFTVGPSPNDPQGQYNWFKTTPEYETWKKSQEGIATQNNFNNNINKHTFEYQRDVARQGANTQEQQMEINRMTARAQIEQAKGKLGLDTLTLGSNLSGPRKWVAYEEAAGASRNNPLLAQGVAAFADPSNYLPKNTGGWRGSAGPERQTLGGLVSDFGGGGSGGGTDWFTGGAPSSNPTAYNGVNQNDTVSALRSIGQSGRAHPGWWGSLDPAQKQMAFGAWETGGMDPDQTLYRIGMNSPGQRLGSTRYA